MINDVSPSLKQRLALELERQVRKNDIKLHTLKQLFWECTLRCNLHCKHCGSDCRTTASFQDMPASDFLRVIDNITPHVDTHKVMIIFTGGEPLMRDDLEQIGFELNKREYPWGIVSNGLFLTPERFKSLLRAGLHSATISLDGMEDDHNWMRGHNKSFAKASEAIHMLANTSSIKFDVVTCVNGRNIYSLEQIKEYLISLGVRHWRLFTIFPVGRAAEHPEFQLSDNDLTKVMKFIEATRNEGKINVSYGCEGFLGKYEGKVRNNFYRCNAGIKVASILADGSISACPSIRYKFNQGNIYKDDFWNVWESRYEPFRNRQWAKSGICADCSMYRYCEGNGMHLHDEDGKLMLCHYHRLTE